MTNIEKRTILEGAQNRTYAALSGVDAWDATTVNNLLHNIAELDYLLNNNVRLTQKEEGQDAPAAGDSEAPAGAEKAAGEVVHPEPESTPAQTEAPSPDPELTKAEVKAKLLELSNQCDALDIAAVMSGMGYSKLSDVPGEQYGELLRRAEAAVKELS